VGGDRALARAELDALFRVQDAYERSIDKLVKMKMTVESLRWHIFYWFEDARADLLAAADRQPSSDSELYADALDKQRFAKQRSAVALAIVNAGRARRGEPLIGERKKDDKK
jgi:hypothetical protein